MENISLIAVLFGSISVAALMSVFDDDDETDASAELIDEEAGEFDGSADEDSGEDDAVTEEDDSDISITPEEAGGTVEIVDGEIVVRGDDTQEWRSWAEDEQGGLGRWAGGVFSYKSLDNSVDVNHGQGGYVKDDSYGIYNHISSHEGNSFVSLPGLLQVKGTSDADTITLFGTDIDLRSSGGGDYVDATNLTSGWVYATDGDTVLSSTVVDNQIDYNGENYDFLGNAMDEVVGLGGSGSGTVFAGDGDDTIIGYGSDDHQYLGEGGDDVIFAVVSGNASGGDGNDYVSGIRYTRELPADLVRTSSGSSNHAMLDGGADNDAMYFDNGDTVTGGDGADTFDGFLKSADGSAAVVTDFNPSEDSMTIWIREELTGGAASDVSLIEANGNTSIMIAGSETAVIAGQTGLTVGFYDLEDRDDTGQLPSDATIVDADGNEIERDSVDIVICTYFDAYKYPWD